MGRQGEKRQQQPFSGSKERGKDGCKVNSGRRGITNPRLKVRTLLDPTFQVLPRQQVSSQLRTSRFWRGNNISREQRKMDAGKDVPSQIHTQTGGAGTALQQTSKRLSDHNIRGQMMPSRRLSGIARATLTETMPTGSISSSGKLRIKCNNYTRNSSVIFFFFFFSFLFFTAK